MSSSAPKQAHAIANDPVLAAIDAAPVVPFTSDEDDAFDVGLADIRAGRTRTHSQVVAGLEHNSDE